MAESNPELNPQILDENRIWYENPETQAVLGENPVFKKALTDIRVILSELEIPTADSITAEYKLAMAFLEGMGADPLVEGVRNKAGFQQALEIEIRRYNREVRKSEKEGKEPPRAPSILMLDLDGFKPINDVLGHPAGDRMLRTVGNELKDNSRFTDTVARLGGDEFALLMPETDRLGGLVVAYRLLTGIERLSPPDHHVTASIGVIDIPFGSSIEDVMNGVDRVMYAAKRGGKNRIAVAGENPGLERLPQSIKNTVMMVPQST